MARPTARRSALVPRADQAAEIRAARAAGVEAARRVITRRVNAHGVNAHVLAAARRDVRRLTLGLALKLALFLLARAFSLLLRLPFTLLLKLPRARGFQLATRLRVRRRKLLDARV